MARDLGLALVERSSELANAQLAFTYDEERDLGSSVIGQTLEQRDLYEELDGLLRSPDASTTTFFKAATAGGKTWRLRAG